MARNPLTDVTSKTNMKLVLNIYVSDTSLLHIISLPELNILKILNWWKLALRTSINNKKKQLIIIFKTLLASFEPKVPKLNSSQQEQDIFGRMNGKFCALVSTRVYELKLIRFLTNFPELEIVFLRKSIFAKILPYPIFDSPENLGQEQSYRLLPSFSLLARDELFVSFKNYDGN